MSRRPPATIRAIPYTGDPHTGDPHTADPHSRHRPSLAATGSRDHYAKGSR